MPGGEVPSRLYRTAVRQLLFRWVPPAGADPDAALRAHLEARYAEEKARWAAVAGQDAGAETTAVRNGLFVLAAGVFAYGRLEAAADVVDHVPSSGAVRRLALALAALLPLPPGLDPLADPEGFRRWLGAQRGALRWDEARGVYAAATGPG